MIEEDDARARILAAVPDPRPMSLPLEESFGHYALELALARIAIPRFDNSAMDGYAVRSADAVQGAELQVVGEQPAGVDLDLAIGEGEALRIFTGAPMPRGADAVVMQEDTERDGEKVKLTEESELGEFVRRAGGDLCVGQQVIAAGDRVNPQRVGLLASQGLAELAVGKPPRVGVLSTGDELRAAGEELGPGEIFESNGKMLAAMARRVLPPGAEVRRYHARDELEELRSVVETAAAENEVLVIAGGVSVGDRDLVKPVLAELGMEMDFWRVRLKPGKPFLFGRTGSGVLVFGLPGNPVSAFVTFEAFVSPALRRFSGAGDGELMGRRIGCRLAEAVANPGGRPQYIRGTLDREGQQFFPSGMQQSHALSGLAAADALLRMGAGEELEAGAEIRVFSVA